MPLILYKLGGSLLTLPDLDSRLMVLFRQPLPAPLAGAADGPTRGPCSLGAAARRTSSANGIVIIVWETSGRTTWRSPQWASTRGW